ncbi:MAG: GGDEF domain-containing protein [Treponema sp.]|nr:GGDEF domain-containing protein [Treponema sp.]
MYEVFYRAEVNVICLMMLVWISFRSKVLSDKQTRRILFQKIILSTVILMLVDTALIFVDSRAGSVFYVSNWLLNLIYFSLNAVAAFFWSGYIIYYIYGNLKVINIFNSLLIPILAVYAMIVLSSPITHLVFYINPQSNTLEEGALYWLQLVVTYGLFTSSSFIALLSIFQKRKWPAYYHRYVTFFSFVFFPLLGGVLHLIFPESKTVWQCLTLAFILVYTEFQFDLISKDSLTGLNNRRSFDQKLKNLSDFSDSSALMQNHIFMLDINFFKDINDKFGHPEGDQALIKTADLLKKILGNTNAFLSRFGGDEFAIILCCSNEEAGKLRINLYKAFDEYNKSEENPYRISISVGYAPVVGNGKNAAQNALKKADDELYSEKEFMHQALSQVDALIRKN